jgi:hypothetical protein
MKAIKIVVGLTLIYLAIIIIFESLIGVFQPASQTTLVITTSDEAGVTNDRVLARLDSDGHIYVAANHWPRAWYNQALSNPNVQVTTDGAMGDYLAVPITDAEHDRVNEEHAAGLGFRILTGFPPRYFVRLDPR